MGQRERIFPTPTMVQINNDCFSLYTDYRFVCFFASLVVISKLLQPLMCEQSSVVRVGCLTRVYRFYFLCLKNTNPFTRKGSEVWTPHKGEALVIAASAE
jgi:hypothetical protein